MTNSCRLLATEYSRNYVKRKPKPAERFTPRDYFSERIRDGEIDPLVASIPTQLDEAAEQLVYKHIIDNLQTVYQKSYKNPRKRVKIEDKSESKGTDFENELLGYIQSLYFNRHEEKVLAPLVTMKRFCGYIRPKLLHGNLSVYQDTFGRTGATIMLQENDKKVARNFDQIKPVKISPCNFDS